MKEIEISDLRGNPVITMLGLMTEGCEFEPVDMPKCEQKWYFNENGEYVRYDG